MYSTYVGGSGGATYGQSIAVDSSNRAYITGYTSASNFPRVGSGTASNSGGNDVFVTEINAAGSAFIYSSCSGSAGDDRGYGIAIGPSGDIFLTGVAGSGFPIFPGAYQTSFDAGTHDAFVTRFTISSGGAISLTYSTYIGGSGDDQAYAVAVDSNNNAWIAGQTASTNFPTTAGAYERTSSGMNDGFVAELDPSGGTLSYSTYLDNSSGNTAANGVASQGRLVAVTGQTNGSGFATTAGAYDTTFAAGGGDAFVMQFSGNRAGAVGGEQRHIHQRERDDPQQHRHACLGADLRKVHRCRQRSGGHCRHWRR